MKYLLQSIILLAALNIGNIATAGTTYNVNSSRTYSSAKIPTSCTDCVINIVDGAVLTIDQDVFFQNTTFNGGSVVLDKNNMTFWSASAFNGVAVLFKNGANLVNSGALTISNSAFSFSGKSIATVYTSVSLISSNWSFVDDAYMEATGGTFSLTSSSLSAGDGSLASKAYLKFNGAAFSVADATSFLSVGNVNNYYFNWGAYKGGKNSVKTTDNNLNCGTGSKNGCSSPSLYGPSTLNSTGVSSNATLPIVLADFSVKNRSKVVDISWTTATEKNSSHFEIEKSADGIHWTVAGTVDAKTNTSSTVSYSFTDASIASGTISYRLKMVDQDEAFEYSPIKSVKMAGAAAISLKMYPNPTTDHVVISAASSNSQMSVQLMTMSGQVLKQVISNSSKTTLSVSEFGAGNYLMRVSDNTGDSQILKLVVLR